MEKQRTDLQNRALHKWFEMVAETFNETGLTLAQILERAKLDIPATKENVKLNVWKPIQEAMFDKKSTTELTTQDIDKVYDVINKTFGEIGIEIPPFPSIENER